MKLDGMSFEGDNEIIRELLQLIEKDRTLLLLKYIYGYKHAEIGVFMGMTEEAAKKAVRRAEERMKKKCREDNLL